MMPRFRSSGYTHVDLTIVHFVQVLHVRYGIHLDLLCENTRKRKKLQIILI